MHPCIVQRRFTFVPELCHTVPSPRAVLCPVPIANNGDAIVAKARPGGGTKILTPGSFQQLLQLFFCEILFFHVKFFCGPSEATLRLLLLPSRFGWHIVVKEQFILRSPIMRRFGCRINSKAKNGLLLLPASEQLAALQRCD